MTQPLMEPTPWQVVQRTWIRHRWVDFVVGLVVILVWYLLTSQCWFAESRCVLPEVLTAVPPESRRTVYQILAAAAATMGGFTLTSVSILVNLLRTPLSAIDRLLPAEDKARVGSVFLGVLPWLVALFIAALAGLASDTGVLQGYWWLQLTIIGLCLSATLSLARVVWVLRRLLAISAD